MYRVYVYDKGLVVAQKDFTTRGGAMEWAAAMERAGKGVTEIKYIDDNR